MEEQHGHVRIGGSVRTEEENLIGSTGEINVNTDVQYRQKKFKWSTAVEIPIFLIMFAALMSDGPIMNIIMYRTCVHSLQYPVERCRPFLSPDKNNETRDIEHKVQEYATFVSTVKMVLQSLCPAILSLFIVVWSDRHGRKPVILWPMIGITLTAIMTVVFSMVDSLGPWWYIAMSVPSLMGRYSIMITGAMCYATDVTDDQRRSMRLMVVQAMVAAGIAGGTASSAPLLQQLGHVYLLLFAAATCTFAYALTALCVQESLQNLHQGSILTVLDFSLVKELFRECFKKRPYSTRAQILLATAVSSIDSFSAYGVAGLSYLYMREVLQWSLEDYTKYSSTSIVISFIGSFFGIAVIQKRLHVGDLTFSMLGALTAAVNGFIKAFAVAGWQMYLGSCISLFSSLISPLTSSFVSKILPAEDVAKVFALMCAIEGLCPLVAPVFFNAIYAETLNTVPGAVYVATGSLSLIAFLLLGVTAYFRWNAIKTNNVTLSFHEEM